MRALIITCSGQSELELEREPDGAYKLISTSIMGGFTTEKHININAIGAAVVKGDDIDVKGVTVAPMSC